MCKTYEALLARESILPSSRRRNITRKGIFRPGTPRRGAHWGFSGPDVVLHSLLALIPSSPGTTSSEPNESSAARTWCFTPRQPVFLRRQAPRPPSQMSLRRPGRGASLPASLCSFVQKHHVPRAKQGFSAPGVVLHSPLALVPSFRSTTSPKSEGTLRRRSGPGPVALTQMLGLSH